MPGEGKRKAKRVQLAKTGRTETFHSAQEMVSQGKTTPFCRALLITVRLCPAHSSLEVRREAAFLGA